MNEAQFLDRGEYVLRRIPPGRDYFKPELAMPVTVLAFRPRENEIHGISVYWEKKVTPAQVAKIRPTPGYVARLAVSDLHELNLTVFLSPNLLPGHAVIPEVNRKDYESSPDRVKELQFFLAQLASRDIVYRPVS